MKLDYLPMMARQQLKKQHIRQDKIARISAWSGEPNYVDSPTLDSCIPKNEIRSIAFA